ncbi:MAG: hypothetical protein H6709_18465 [Kofleriaceae bacterium]|nr:hypothetical protein [Kofleriaceae bacterium]
MTRARFAAGFAAVAGAIACAACPGSPSHPRGAIGAPVAAWLPADVEAAVVVPGDGAAAAAPLALLRAMELGDATAGAWALLDVEGPVTARCVADADAPGRAAALVAAGAAVATSAGAQLLEHDDAITIVRDGVTCDVTGGAASRRRRHAVRLAGLDDAERLVAAPATRRWLDALPPAPLRVWARDGYVDAVMAAVGLPAGLLDPGGASAIALDADATGRVVLTLVGPAAVVTQAAARTEATVHVGALLRPPAEPALVPPPAVPTDDNPDVPLSQAYQAAVARLGDTLGAAALTQHRVVEQLQAVRAAWVDAWGEATVVATRTPPAVRVEVTWQAPAWPPDAVRARADAAATAARAGLDTLRAERQRLVDDAAAQIHELIVLRARDVAAWDREHR